MKQCFFLRSCPRAAEFFCQRSQFVLHPFDLFFIVCRDLIGDDRPCHGIEGRKGFLLFPVDLRRILVELGDLIIKFLEIVDRLSFLSGGSSSRSPFISFLFARIFARIPSPSFSTSM